MRQGDDFRYDQHSQDGRYPYDRGRPPSEEPRQGVMNPAPHWERDVRYDYGKEANPWIDRVPRLALEA